MLCSELPEDDDCCSASQRSRRVRRSPPGGRRIRCWGLMLRSAASFIVLGVSSSLTGFLQYDGCGSQGACRQGILAACLLLWLGCSSSARGKRSLVQARQAFCMQARLPLCQ